MPKHIALRLFALLTLCSFFLSPGNFAQAQSNIQVQENRADLDFPNKLTFVLEAKSSSPIDKVTLVYGTNGRTCVRGSARQQVEITPGTTVSGSWEWDFKDSGNLPPGAEISWQWEISDEAGNQLRTEMMSLTVEDSRLDWNTISSDQVTIVWSEGPRSFGQQMLDISTASLNRLETQAGIRPPGKVRLTVFPSYEALRSAGLFLPEWTGGVAFIEYSTTMIGLPVNSTDAWLDEVIPHELAHLVTGTLVYNCLGVDMPTWLSEGFSVYAEGEASSNNVEEMLDALEAGTLPPLRNLAEGFSADSGQAIMSYTQSGEVVRFLIDTYGSQKISDLLAALKSGKTINPALQQVYALDTDSLDNAWRQSLGFAPVTSGASASSTQVVQRTLVPTLALWTQAFGQPGGGPAATVTPAPVVDIPPVVEVTVCPGGVPCTIEEAGLASPTAGSIGSAAGTAVPASTPRSSSPLTCLGFNLVGGFVLVSISLYLHLVRRITN